jgi:hypothetical protein
MVTTRPWCEGFTSPLANCVSGSKLFIDVHVIFDILNIPKKAKGIVTAKKVYIGCIFIFNSNCDN